jgi:hypothetical protein
MVICFQSLKNEFTTLSGRLIEDLELTKELDLHILKILIKQQPKRGGEIKRDLRGVCVCVCV